MNSCHPPGPAVRVGIGIAGADEQIIETIAIDGPRRLLTEKPASSLVSAPKMVTPSATLAFQGWRDR